MKALEHFKTITHHRHLVMGYCFKLGLYKQGFLHDLSKYAPVEFLVGCRYYQGDRSPNNAEREATGVSMAWLHHKGRNKHHFEYWIDYSLNPGDASALEYYKKGCHKYIMHPKTAELLEKLLVMLAEKGEEETFSYVRYQVLHNA